MAKVVSYQEETLLGLMALKEMSRWFKRSHRVLEQIQYVWEIQKGRGSEEHGIRMLQDGSLARFQKAVECWTQLVVEPQQNMKDRWEECLKNWEKINQRMRDIQLPDFGMPEDFVDLHDIVKQHGEQDQSSRQMFSESQLWRQDR
jgi:hypothetical protein